MLKSIYALYPDPDSAERAARALRNMVAESRIAVLSPEPYEEYEFGRPKDGTAMPWFAAFGGLVGGLSGYALTALAQRAFPLPTGGMAIVPLWTNGIIMYEMTMLGAILATAVTLLVSAPLPEVRKRLYDPEIAGGRILVGVLEVPEVSRAQIESAMLAAGAAQVKEFPPG